MAANGGEFGAEESVQLSTDGMLISIQTGYYVESHNYEKGEYENNWQNYGLIALINLKVMERQISLHGILNLTTVNKLSFCRFNNTKAVERIEV